jgi:predicted ArsR family transcriptional regulator
MSRGPSPALTTRQALVLSLVETYYETLQVGCPASFVAQRLGLHHETVRQHFLALHRRGWLESESCPAIPRRPFLSRSA